MAERKRKKGGRKDGAGAAPARPVRPFLAGIGVAAAWGALHIPAALWSLVLGGFAVELLAIAIAAGGIIAVSLDVLTVLVNRLPWILAALSRRS